MWQDFIQQVNQFSKAKTSFFFLIDFEQQKPILCPLNQMAEQGIFVQFPDYTNVNWLEDCRIKHRRCHLFIYINSQ